MAMKRAAEAEQSRQEDEVPEKPSVLREMSGLILTLSTVDEWLRVLRKDRWIQLFNLPEPKFQDELCKDPFSVCNPGFSQLVQLASSAQGDSVRQTIFQSGHNPECHCH
jgi:hypothetical protein